MRPFRQAHETRGVFTRRALMIAGAQVGVLGLLGARLYQVQVAQGRHFALLARGNRVSTRLIAPPRGEIQDRFGITVAGNKLNWRALLMVEETQDAAATLDRFGMILPFDPHEREKLDRAVARHQRFIPVLVKDFLDWDQMAAIEANTPDLPGIVIDVGTTRLYPFGDGLAHLVGYVAPPSEQEVAGNPLLALPGVRVGRAGVEQFHEPTLRGRAGEAQLEVSPVGRVVRELDRQDGIPGPDIGLTIDSALQQAVLGHLGDESASAVVIDCTNGEVLAMASNPGFDPTLFDAGVSEAQWQAWNADPRTPLLNKPCSGLYAPGSTFKVAVALAALNSGVLSPTDRIDCPGYFDLGNARFHCWKKGGHGSLDLHGGIKNSCDVFFYETARRVGIDRIAAHAHALGLGVDLPIEQPHARRGLIPTVAWRRRHGHRWNPGDTVVAGIGQGYIQVTPLQLATYAARVASGIAVVPHLTRTIAGATPPGADAAGAPPLDLPVPMLAAVRAGMWAVVNDPTGTAPLARLSLPGVEMAGKTGSAQVRHVSRWVRENTNFDSSKLPWQDRPHALFIAFAPYDSPRYALSVVIEHGNAGAAAAAPMARDIMTDVLTRDPARRVPPPAEQVSQSSEAPAAPPRNQAGSAGLTSPASLPLQPPPGKPWR
jgi:penicillin-binding protein 2